MVESSAEQLGYTIVATVTPISFAERGETDYFAISLKLAGVSV